MGPRRPSVFLLSAIWPACLGGALVLVWAGAALAGAWTQAPGVGFTSQTFRYFTTKGGENPTFTRGSLTAYAEYGLLERLTIGGELDQGARLDDAARGAQTGRASAFLRWGLLRGEAGDVAAIQVGGSTPLSGFVSPAAPGGDEADEFEAQIIYGRGFFGDWGSGWAEIGFGLSHFTGPRADEAKLDLVLGYRPDDDWLLMAKTFGTFGLRNNAFGGTDFDTVKVELSVGRRIFGDRTLLLGVARDLHTRGTDPGLEVSLSIWSRF